MDCLSHSASFDQLRRPSGILHRDRDGPLLADQNNQLLAAPNGRGARNPRHILGLNESRP